VINLDLDIMAEFNSQIKANQNQIGITEMKIEKEKPV
jgi:hypothetical protein